MTLGDFLVSKKQFIDPIFQEVAAVLEIEMPDEGFGNLKELFPEDILAP